MWALGLGLAGLVLLAGCNRRTEPYLPPDQEPPPPSKPVTIPSLTTPPEQLGGMPGGMRSDSAAARSAAAAASDASASPTQAAAEGGAAPIRGTLRLGEGVEDPGSGVVFVIVRNMPGPPLASLKLPVGSFPMEFRIGPENVMMGTRAFEGEMTISARIDRDGNPMTRESGNLVGELPTKVRPGDSDVEIVLTPSDG